MSAVLSDGAAAHRAAQYITDHFRQRDDPDRVAPQHLAEIHPFAAQQRQRAHRLLVISVHRLRLGTLQLHSRQDPVGAPVCMHNIDNCLMAISLSIHK